MPDFDPGTRKVLYLLAWIVGSISGTLTAVWGAVAAASPDVSMPLWLVITSAALTSVAARRCGRRRVALDRPPTQPLPSSRREGLLWRART
jgi:hypothetical protein